MSVYVYAVTASAHPKRLEGLQGVGDPPTELRTVSSGGLTAVVSKAPEGLRAKRRDILAHQQVLERLLADGTILPMRFGLAADDDDAVRAVLEDRAQEYTERLGALEGCLEYNLKALQDEEVMLRQVLEQSEELRQLNELTRSDVGTYDDRLALGEMVVREIQSRHEALSAEIVDALRPVTKAETTAPPSAERFLNVSFLVEREREKEFTAAAEELTKRYGPDVELRLRGPLPPYSFASSDT